MNHSGQIIQTCTSAPNIFISFLEQYREVQISAQKPGTIDMYAAVANNNHLAPKFSCVQVYYTSLIILSKFGPNQFISSRENAKKTKLPALTARKKI